MDTLEALRLYVTIAETGSLSGPPSNWFTLDPVEPVSFRTFTISMTASGNFNPFDTRGAVIRLSNVALRMLPAEVIQSDRQKSGCDFPPGP